MDELTNENVLVRLYAILGLEEIGEEALPARQMIEAKKKDNYEYVRRVARRLEKRYVSADKADNETKKRKPV